MESAWVWVPAEWAEARAAEQAARSLELAQAVAPALAWASGSLALSMSLDPALPLRLGLEVSEVGGVKGALLPLRCPSCSSLSMGL